LSWASLGNGGRWRDDDSRRHYTNVALAAAAAAGCSTDTTYRFQVIESPYSTRPVAGLFSPVQHCPAF